MFVPTRILIPALGGLLIGFTPVKLNAQRGGPAGPVDPVAAERGRGIFSANCSFCHGSQAQGTEQAPPLVRNFMVNQDRNGEVLGPAIKAGRPPAMPAFPNLQPREIADLVAFIHLRNSEGRGAPVPETALLVGDAKAGEVYFNGAAKCSTCHSLTGDLKGIGSKYAPRQLTIAFLTPERRKPVEVKVTLPSGSTISGKLRYIDEFAVSLDDAAGEYRSWNRSALKNVEVLDPLAQHKAMLIKYTDPDIRNLLAYLATIK